MPKFPTKAYKNQDFLNSAPARHIRILCEYEEPRQRFLQEGIKNTIVFFGSARLIAGDEAQAALEELKGRPATEGTADELAAEIKRAEVQLHMSTYYDDARELARRLTAWDVKKNGSNHNVICSGGGPGIMEAANRGAADVEGGRSVGLGISLPFEPGVNDWVSDELAFEFHYFFTRKYWFLYLCKALVIFPGGFGTLDEFFETLTLIQTQKIKKKIPIVLYGKDYWNEVFNIDAMVKYGTIAAEDMDLVFQTNSVDEAFDYLAKRL